MNIGKVARSFLKRLNTWSIFGTILILSLVAFEAFNFDSTRYALSTIFGDRAILGVAWASVLAVAFCGIDFAGVARIFTPESNLKDEPVEVFLLMGAWLIAAIFNATLHWWTISNLVAQTNLSNTLVTNQQFVTYAPIMIAGIIFLARILIIGTISTAGDHLLNAHARPSHSGASKTAPLSRRSVTSAPSHMPPLRPVAMSKPAPQPQPSPNGSRFDEDSFMKQILNG